MALEGLHIRVPASTSNLGPGLDTLGLALQLYLDVTVRRVTDEGRIVCTFEGKEPEGENKLAGAYETAAERERVRAPGLHVDIRNDIPVRTGLGSSAAAVVAGLRLFEAANGERSSQWRLSLATELEGHPDNATPAVLGGFTVSCQCDDGSVRAVAVPWPERIHVLVATPPDGLETAVARRALPRTIARADAVFNLQRVALLLQAIRTERFEHLSEALRDRWHQSYRVPLVPVLVEALALRHPALIGTFLSGAGPSVIALTEGPSPDVEDLLRATYAARGLRCEIRRVAVHQPE